MLNSLRKNPMTLAQDVITAMEDVESINPAVAANLRGFIEDKGPAKLVPEILDKGFPSQPIADALSDVIGLPIYNGSDEPIVNTSSALLTTDHIMYVNNPLDRASLNRLVVEHGDSIYGWGILPVGADINVGGPDVIISGGNHSEVDRILHEILQGALSKRASDLHFAPQGKEVFINLRVDGQMLEYKRMPLDHVYMSLANKIMIRSGKNAGEFIAPADGSFKLELADKSLTFRMAMAPTMVDSQTWPKFTLRLPSLAAPMMNIEQLGFLDTEDFPQAETMKGLSKIPQGLILVSGPTGSGKTTTMLAMLRHMTRNMPEKCYYSIEDPVEIEVPGVNQMSTNDRSGLTFAAGLRSCLRHDPDCIMVGEIRDKETLELAVQASLTGHLVLSTIHTKTGPDAIPRMIELGLDPSLLATSLTAVIAQRMAKLLCNGCKVETTIEAVLRGDVRLRDSSRLEVYQAFARDCRDLLWEPNEDGEHEIAIAGGGCDRCGRTGYAGRKVVAEILTMSASMERLVTEKASKGAIVDEAEKFGYKDFWQSAAVLLANKETSLEVIDRALGVRINPHTH